MTIPMQTHAICQSKFGPEAASSFCCCSPMLLFPILRETWAAMMAVLSCFAAEARKTATATSCLIWVSWVFALYEKSKLLEKTYQCSLSHTGRDKGHHAADERQWYGQKCQNGLVICSDRFCNSIIIHVCIQG